MLLRDFVSSWFFINHRVARTWLCMCRTDRCFCVCNSFSPDPLILQGTVQSLYSGAHPCGTWGTQKIRCIPGDSSILSNALCCPCHGLNHDIILRMAEKNERPHTEEEKPKEGQVLGCVFALVAVGFIFVALFVFLRACA